MLMYLIQQLLNWLGPEGKVSDKPLERKFDVPDCDLVRDVQPGDIIVYRFGSKDDFTGGIISHMTSSPYSHAELHIKDGHDISATSHGIGFVDLFQNNIKGKKAVIGGIQPFNVDVFRLKGGLSREQRLIIEAKAFESLLMPYDYINLAWFNYFTPEGAAKRAGNEAYICSEHVAWAYNNAGIDLIKDRPESIEAPADIGRSDVLEYIGTYVEGVKLQDDLRNKFLDEEYSNLQKLISTFMGLFSKKDEYYQGVAINKDLLEGEVKL